MNKKVLAAAIALLMIMGTVLITVPIPVNAIINPQPVLSATPGQAGSTLSVTAPGWSPVVQSLTPNRTAFVLFDKEVADADLGARLEPFTANDYFNDTLAVGWHVIGDPIYRDVPAPDPGAGSISPGDVRLTPVTVHGATYGAMSTVQAGDLDIINSGLLGIPVAAPDLFWTNATATWTFPNGSIPVFFNWDRGDGLYLHDANNTIAFPWQRVGSGDMRARWPSLTATNAAGTYTYAAWTKVRAPVLDFGKSIHTLVANHTVTAGVTVMVAKGDTRVRNVVIPQVRYAAASTVTAGDQDLRVPLTVRRFVPPWLAPHEAFADLNGNGVWDLGEPIYRSALAWPDLTVTNTTRAGDLRETYVTVTTAAATFTYLPETFVQAEDADFGLTVRCFGSYVGTPPVYTETQSYYDANADGFFQYGEWVYNRAATAGPTGIVAGTVRASAVDWTDKGMANIASGVLNLHRLVVAPWGTDWNNVVGYASASTVWPGDSDFGRILSPFAATDHHAAAGAYAKGNAIWRDVDNDNFVSVGDVRESLIWNGLARVFNGPWPWTAANAPFYMPGTTVAAGDADIGIALNAFAATEYYYDQFGDGAYLGSDLVAMGGTTNGGNARPFPLTLNGAAAPISFTVPSNAPVGNHAIFIITDQPPTATGAGGGALTAPFASAGFQAGLAFPAAPSTLPLDPLPWFQGRSPGAGVLNRWSLLDFGSQAGLAFFFAVIPKVCAVQMSPGAYAHTLGTPASIVKLDYTKSSIIQNETGDVSLNITLCSKASSISIYIPPEFTFLQPDTTSVWTSITNDYKHVSMVKLNSMDPIGPLWWNVRIADLAIPLGSYVVRMFNMKAPDVCGRYFVKVFIDGESIGSGNFPTIVVKGSLDPAYISGRVLNGDHGVYGVPVNVSGKVIAEGTTALGRTVKAQAYFNASANGAYTLYGLAPGTYNLAASAAGFAPTTVNGTVTVYAGQSLGVDIYVYPSATISGTLCSKCGAGLIPWGSAHSRPISMEILDFNLESKAWFATNKTDYDPSQAYYQFSFDGSIELDGHVPQDYAGYVSGLGPGDYYLKAYVNGYLQRDVVPVHVYKYSRSVSIPFDLWRSSQFEVTVHFRDSGGSPSPTPKGGKLTLEAYPLDGTLGGSNSTFVPEGSLTWTMAITGKRDCGLPSGTYFIEADFPGYSQATLSQATLGEGCSTTSLSFDIVKGGVLEVALRSVNWQTPPLEVPWEYPNATMRLEVIGSIGQVYVGTAKQLKDQTVSIANVTGLPTDTYLVRVYTVGYIQTTDYRVSVSSVGTSDMTVYLVEATRLNVEFTFRKEGLVASIDTYARYNLTEVPARIEVYDSLGVLVGANATYIPADASSYAVEVVGFRAYAGNPCLRWVNYYDTTDGSLQKDYGLPPGTYQVLVWVPGYVQAQTAILSTTPRSTAGMTLSLDRLAHVNGTISGLDMHEDLIPLSWATVTAYGPILTATSSLDGFYEMWIVNGTYTLGVSSPGYEAQGVEIHVSMAWETSVDFDLRPPSGTIPELSATELMSAAVLVIACASLRRSPPAS